MPIPTNIATLINFGSAMRINGAFGKMCKFRYFHPIPSGDCIVAAHRKHSPNYSRVNIAGKPQYVHRLLWEYLYGEIPQGMHVLHRCDNPPCLNPDHLFLGTQADNNIDRAKKERGNVSKTSPQQVREIRESKLKNIVLASIYNVTPDAISRIKNRKRRIYV